MYLSSAGLRRPGLRLILLALVISVVLPSSAPALAHRHHHPRRARHHHHVRRHGRKHARATRTAPSITSGAIVGTYGPPPVGVAGPPVANFNRETYQFASALPMAQEASRYQSIVLQANQYWLVPLLHALNPNLKVLVYQSIMHTNRDDPSYLPTVTGCTAYRADLLAHPEWFLHDQYGSPINEPNTTAVYAMDVGNPSYQVQCALGATVLAKQYGFDGVFWDVVSGRLNWVVAPGVSVREYSSSDSWAAAMTSALDYIAPALRRQGLISIGNIATLSVPTWERWAGVLDGVEEESWTDGGMGPLQLVPYFRSRLAELAWTQANGKYELVHSYSGSETANTYGLAAMLLAANGYASYSTSNTNYTSNENWFPEYSLAQSLGAPAGGYTVLRNGVYERAFSNGIVLVNPTARSVPNFWLGGGVYSGSGLSNATAVSMPPTSGLILLKVG